MPGPHDINSAPLDTAAETYREYLDVNQERSVYSHTSGAAGKKNVVVLAIAFDSRKELTAAVAETLADLFKG